MKKAKKHEKSNVSRMISGFIAAYAVIFVLLFIMAGLTSKGTVPESVMKPAVIISCFIGGLAGGITALTGYTGRRLVPAAGLGGLILLLMLLAGLGMAGEQGFAGQFIINAAAAFAGIFIVSFAGRKKAHIRR